MGHSFDIDRHTQTATEFVATEIRRQILTGELKRNTPLRQESIAEQLSVSRMPVRDALRILESEGLVHFRRNRGFTVLGIGSQQIIETALIRYQLESLALEHAIPRHTEETIEEARAALELVQLKSQLDEEAHLKFHKSLYRPCGMPRLMSMIEFNMRASRVRTVAEGLLKPSAVQQDVIEHQSLFDAVCNGEAKIAASILHIHTLQGAEELARMIEEKNMAS